MRTALVLGINGGFGGHVAQALSCKGWAIKALLRHQVNLASSTAKTEVVRGDANNIEDVRRAAHGADIIVYGISPAKYRWRGIILPLLEKTVTVAEENRQTIIFPGNVYVFDPASGPDFDESALIHPVTSLGEMRKSMEARLRLASERGARVIMLRMGDFIGAGAASTWLGQLIKATKHGYTLSRTGPQGLQHSWAYLPDAADVIVELAQHKDGLPPFSVFHFRGYRASFLDIANAIKLATGKDVKLARFPWVVIGALAPFSVLFRSLKEMRYLWQTEINLSDDKLKQVLNKPLVQTPLAKALVTSGLLTESK